MLRVYKTDGIVLKRKNIGETDRLLTIFTREHGKLVVIAKGIRKITSRKAPHLEPFVRLNLLLARGRSYDHVIEVQTIKKNLNIQKKLERIAVAYKIAELVDRLCPEKEDHEQIFSFVVEALSVINTCQLQDLLTVSEKFSHQLLWELGYLPRSRKLTGITLTNFLENVMESTLKSQVLLTKLHV